MVLAGALCATLLTATGITNKSLRALMTDCSPPLTPTEQMTYDLRRLRLTGLIRRIEHTNRYVLIPDGAKLAIFYTRLHSRLLRPLLAADQPQAPPISGRLCASSTSTSMTTSPAPASAKPRENLTQTFRS
jgi:hypothetical protein